MPKVKRFYLPNSSFISSVKSLPKAASTIVISIGCIVIIGWILDISILKSVFPGLVTMKPNAAIAFVLSGISLWLLHAQSRISSETERQNYASPIFQRMGLLCALVVAIFGLLTISEYIFHWNLGIDRLLFANRLDNVGGFAPGRIAPNSALNYLLIGTSLLILSWNSRLVLSAQILTLTATLVALQPLIGYLYGFPALYSIASYKPMALNTALAFIILSVGILFTHADRGLMQIVTSDRISGLIARRLLIAAIVIPILLGLLILQGQRSGFYDTSFGIPLLVIASIVVFGILIWETAEILERLDIKREQADLALKQSDERYRAFIEQSSEGIWRFELDQPMSINLSEDQQIEHFYQYGYLAECNNVMAQMYGFNSTSEILGAKLGDMLVPSEPQNIEYLKKFIRSGYRLNNAESHEVDKDGNSKYFANNLVGIIENGFLLRAWGTQLDISERKQAEKSLVQLTNQVRSQAQTLDALLQSSVDNIYVFDNLGRYKYVSNGGAKALGHEPVDLINKTIQDLNIPVEIKENFTAQRHKVISTGQPLITELDFITPDGATHYYEYIVAPMLGYDKNISGAIVVSRDITERKQAETALGISETRLRSLVEQSPLSIQIHSPDGKILQVNRAWEQLWGVTLEQIPDYNLLEDQQLVANGVMPYIQKAFGGEAALIPPVLYDPEKTIPDRSIYEESQRWTRSVIYPVKAINGTIQEVVLIHEDISDAKRAEEELRQREDELRIITNSLPVLIASLDCEHRYRFNNTTYEQWFGRAASELYGMHVREVVGEAAYQLVLPYMERVLLGEQVTFESQLPYITGGIRYVQVIYVPRFNQQGKVEGFVTLISDISEAKRDEVVRKQAEQALKESEERFRQLAEKAGVIPWEADATTGDFTYVGPQAVNILGYAVADWYTSNFWVEHIHPEEREQALNYCLEAATIFDNYEFEYRMLAVDGRSVWLYDIVNVVRNDGKPQILRGFLIDITRRKQAEEERERLLKSEQQARQEAEAANRTKDEFLATLSHELRTPLNAMLGWTQLLRTRKFDEATIARALETIDRNTKALAQLIEDVLDVSRIITGKLHLNLYTIEILPVVEAAIDTVGSAAIAKEIQIELILNTSKGQVLGDSTRLQQVIWNLLANAVKFTPRKGRVEVLLQTKNEQIDYSTDPCQYVEIKISDTGQGISPDFLPYIFERFRQADGSITRTHGGLGLGLAIVRHLVELHGGTVYADSAGLGKGATFTVQLPLLKDENSKMAEQLSLPSSFIVDSSSLLTGVQVLIVDDEADARDLLSAILQDYGAEVIVAVSAEEALAKLKLLKPNILVSDIGMPEEDGYSLVRKVRQLTPEEGGKIPCVALTAYASTEDRTRSLSAGFQLHVPKPVNPTELGVAIANLLGRV